MSLVHLQFVDWLIILVYFAFVIGIGLYIRNFTTTAKDFFLAGRRNSAVVAGIAFLSANMGALELLGMSGQAYKYGMLVAHFYWIGAVPAMLFLGVFMMPFYYSAKIHSVPGYLKLRFNGSTRTLNAIAFAVMTLLMSGINMYAMALVLHIFVGWNISFCFWISAITIAIYITFGGLISAIFTEVLQFFLIWFGILLVVILGWHYIGGWHQIAARIPESFTHVWANTGSANNNSMFINWAGIVMGLGFVLSFGYWTTDFLVIQRAFSAKDLNAARNTPIFAAFFKMALPIIVVLPGLIALALVHKGQMATPARPDDALLYLMGKFYPHGLLGLGVTALLAGFMAGQAGNITAFTTVWTYDIYRVHLHKTASDKYYVYIGRLATIVGVFLSIITAYWAMNMPSIMEYMQALFSIVNAPLFATILLGMFWLRATGPAAFIGLLVGMVASTAMFILGYFHLLPLQIFAFDKNASPMAANFWRAVWAWGITFVVTIVVSYCTSPTSKERLHGLTVYTTPKPEVQHSLFKRPSLWAVIALVILIIINIIFW